MIYKQQNPPKSKPKNRQTSAEKATNNQPSDSVEEHSVEEHRMVIATWVLHQKIDRITAKRSASSVNYFSLLIQEVKRCNVYSAKCEHTLNVRGQKREYVCATSANRIKRYNFLNC